MSPMPKCQALLCCIFVILFTANMVDTRKTRMIGLPCSEETMTIC